ncbi:hypothetical protein BDY21DRAFT_340758 [Lineolata rhizophorae]|uniref:Uncharacterized protein n=1 Tax=Lineolata rhizophorae TaxID=578093 RepID=A0A6A6P487_9PEZI|nr:hypothetical protein BDY21DRAFT_340758 [Lineolata rhizophorae]
MVADHGQSPGPTASPLGKLYPPTPTVRGGPTASAAGPRGTCSGARRNLFSGRQQRARAGGEKGRNRRPGEAEKREAIERRCGAAMPKTRGARGSG